MLGTGAFTSVEADRTASVAVAGDEDAFLRLAPCTDDSGNVLPNGEYVQEEDGMLTLDLTGDNSTPSGTGVNAEATSRFDNVFEIRNQGTQPIGVWLETADAAMADVDGDGDDEPRIEFYRADDPSTDIVDDGSSLNAKCLDVGESVCVGFIIRTQGLSSGDTEDQLFAGSPPTYPGSNDEELVVNGDAEVGCEAPTGGGGSGPRRLSTGVADWQVTSLPSGASPPTGATLPYPAYEITPPQVWATSGTDAEWVDPFNDGERIDDPEGEYDYELEFEVATERTLVVEEYGSDNEVEFFLDGTSIGGTGGGNAFQSLRSNVSNQLVDAGSHTLRAAVYNRPKRSSVPADQDTNPTGLLVAARLDP